jgi:hypothetical protein
MFNQKQIKKDVNAPKINIDATIRLLADKDVRLKVHDG